MYFFPSMDSNQPFSSYFRSLKRRVYNRIPTLLFSLAHYFCGCWLDNQQVGDPAQKCGHNGNKGVPSVALRKYSRKTRSSEASSDFFTRVGQSKHEWHCSLQTKINRENRRLESRELRSGKRSKRNYATNKRLQLGLAQQHI